MEDNFDDFDFESYMAESNREWDSKMEKWKERMVIEAINNNYDNISKNGISETHAGQLSQSDLVDLVETLNFMVDHYIESEEYEKCALLKKELIKIDDLLSKL
jgi:hypothetical protein